MIGFDRQKPLDAVHKSPIHSAPDIIVMSLLLNPPLVIRPGFPPRLFFRTPNARAGYVLEASKMLAMDESSIALNSSSDCCAVRPSVSAREKLAMTPWLRVMRALASSRV